MFALAVGFSLSGRGLFIYAIGLSLKIHRLITKFLSNEECMQNYELCTYQRQRTLDAASVSAFGISWPNKKEFPMENATYQMMSDSWTSNCMLLWTKGKLKAVDYCRYIRGHDVELKTYSFCGLTLSRKHPVDVRWTSKCTTFYTIRIFVQLLHLFTSFVTSLFVDVDSFRPVSLLSYFQAVALRRGAARSCYSADLAGERAMSGCDAK